MGLWTEIMTYTNGMGTANLNFQDLCYRDYLYFAQSYNTLKFHQCEQS